MLYRSFWIGLSRVQFAHPLDNPTVHSAWLDGTPVDYGRYDGLPIPNRDVRPWAYGSPSSLNATTSGEIEGCTQMFLNDNDPQWNDISCYSLLGGVICKRNCSANCPNEDNSTTTTSSTTTAVGLTTQTTEETTTEVQYDEATTEDIETSTPNSCGNNSNICGADGWKWKCFKNGKCYSYHKYSVKGSYWKALAKCRKHHASVCSIETEEENDHVCKHYCGCKGKDVWIDMHRMVTEDGTNIVCLDGDDNKCYTETDKDSKNPWANGCPANASNMDDGKYGKKNCCVISKGKWKDVGCTRPISKVLCKKECVKP
uniref:C-type lectin domain-containing protein n=1 Tax=Meloidogyne incognita TaxID=6306 RepID=A0A914KVV9_MELIC